MKDWLEKIIEKIRVDFDRGSEPCFNVVLARAIREELKRRMPVDGVLSLEAHPLIKDAVTMQNMTNAEWRKALGLEGEVQE